MIINNFRYRKFTLPFKKQFNTSKGNIKSASGFLIELTDEAGNTGFGESTILEEFGGESFYSVENELNSLKPLGLPVNENLSSVIKLNANSLKFAFDQAMLQILIKNNSDVINQYKINANSEIKINGIIGKNKIEDILNEVDLLVSAGYETLKFKLGTMQFTEEIEILNQVFNNYSDIEFRLDVNGKWSYEEALNNLNQLNHLNIQDVEQPVADTEDLLKLAEVSRIPVCADESVRCYPDAEKIILTGLIKHISLKPSLLGSINSFFKLAKLADGKGVNLIITSAFESAIGNSMLLLLASTLQHSLPHGLGTQNLFSKNLLDNQFPVINGNCSFSIEEFSKIKPDIFS